MDVDGPGDSHLAKICSRGQLLQRKNRFFTFVTAGVTNKPPREENPGGSRPAATAPALSRGPLPLPFVADSEHATCVYSRAFGGAPMCFGRRPAAS